MTLKTEIEYTLHVQEKRKLLTIPNKDELYSTVKNQALQYYTDSNITSINTISTTNSKNLATDNEANKQTSHLA